MTIRGVLLALPLMLAGWISVLLAVSYFSDEAPAQVVLFPDPHFLSNLPADISVMGSNSWSVTLSSPESQFARSLYAKGARLVLPAGLLGCLPVPVS